ncbi:MAG: YggS family pyridoxal phosphate-dependent enzyme [Defluviitaleaceae bacterium]|nr:YggS family pyridoxal phosphate-dependent enzyme [Defluviitaleaceae bacterium]
MHIKENADKILAGIAAAAKSAGRRPEDVTLVGVTKTFGVEHIKEAFEAGVVNFGENRVQEFLPKYEALKEFPIKWHFIGHLQRNKVKYIIDKVDMIHSVDSLDLAKEINKQAEKAKKIMQILVEINIAGENSKFGVSPDNAEELMKNLVNMRFLNVAGLMCVPPFVEKAAENRHFFQKMFNLLVDIQRNMIYHGSNHMKVLSMGMSGDYLVAVEEGATIVRIGTSLFDKRN